jgi:murein DD-endopeptidase MepM/ murein hydrolase activator NlpD
MALFRSLRQRSPALLAPCFAALLAPAAAFADDAVAEARLLELRVDRGGIGVDSESPAERAASEARIAATIDRLRSEGRYLPDLAPDGGLHPLWTWPLVNERSGAFEPWSVRNFVDQDPDEGVPQVLDFACGGRTYDGHRGVDISLWPFPWREKTRGSVVIVAAAPGQILSKEEGNPDDSCTNPGQTPRNRVELVHADGTRSIYSHMKTGSLTTKAEGETVARGEYLGRVASSGNSTAPHLHFETRDPEDAVLEPYAGICNETPVGMLSWWVDQPDYWSYKLADLATHSQAPEIPPCPEIEQPHFKRLFAAGEDVRIGIYLNDAAPGDSLSFEVRRPDGTLATSNSFTHDETASRHESHWMFSLPDILLPQWRGPWKIVATVAESGGETVVRERTFWAGVLFADDFERVSLTEAGWQVLIPLP